MAALLQGKNVWWVSLTNDNSRTAFEIASHIAKQIPGVVRTRSPMRFEFGKGFLEFKSAEQKDALRGRGLHLLVCDEFDFWPDDVYEPILEPMLADFADSQAILMSTPNYVGGQFHKLFDRGQSDEFPEYMSWQLPTWDNPEESIRAYAEEKRRTMHQVIFRREFGAEFIAPAGARFPQFSPSTHVARADRNASTYAIMGIDYGHAAPFCALWIRIFPNRDMHVYREVYEAGVFAADQPKKVLDAMFVNEKVRTVFIDPSMWASNQRYDNFQPVISVADYYEDAFREDARIGPVQKGFNKNRKHALATLDTLLDHGNGKPNLTIDPGCVNLIREITNAVWDSKGKEDIDERCADHAITALYYAAHTWLEAPEIIYEPGSEYRRLERDLAERREREIERERKQLAPTGRHRRPIRR